MKKHLRTPFTLLLVALLLTAFLSISSAALALEPTGPPIDSNFVLKGFATIHSTGYPNTVRLVPDATNRYGMMWCKNKIDLTKPFTSIQSIYLGHNSGFTGTVADGLAFVLHNDARGTEAVAEGGAGLGVYGNSYIKNSLVIEFDTYCNTDSNWPSTDPYRAGVNSHSAFVIPRGNRISVGEHYNTQWFNVRDVWQKLTIEWQPQQIGQMWGGTLSYYFEGTGVNSSYYISNVNNVFNSTQVWWGFTGATGIYTSSPAVSFAKMPLPQTQSHTLFYNANGGVGAPEAQTGIPSGTFPIISSTIPIRDNYKFLGWAAFPTATSAVYQPGTTIGIGSNGNITLYAVWQYAPAPATYTLSYNANGGSAAPPPQSGIPANTYPIISNIIPDREDYEFLGWATYPTATAAQYQPGNSIGIGNNNITLYAVWGYAPIPTWFVIEYYANGGIGAPARQIEIPRNSYALISTIQPSRPGYDFLGWATTQNAGSPLYQPGDYVFISKYNILLFAVWSAQTVKHTLFFDANGGSGAPNPQTGLDANSYINITNTEPIRAGYRFLGWALSAQATNPQFLAGGIIYIGNSNTTLFAVWAQVAVTTFTLTYDANGGVGAPPQQTGLSANAYAVLSTEEPSRAGYRFMGWGISREVITPQYPAGGFVYISNNNVILYAVWQVVNSYSLSYHANGGSGAPPPQLGIPENSFPFISTIVPKRAGYIFLGWATTPNSTDAPFQPGGTISIANANIVLFAIWEEDILPPSPQDEQIVNKGRPRHYNSSGTELTANPELGKNTVVLVEKSIAETDKENEFDLTLTVKTSVDISQVSTSADAAVVLVLDISGSMGGINDANTDYMPVLRAAAKNFINNLAAEAGDSARYVALVSFETDAKILYSWTDITNSASRQTINNYIDSLPGVGATFLSGGLQLARNLMRTDALPRGRNNTIIENRSVVLFSDGEANKYNVSTSEARFNSGLVVNGTAGPGNGFDPAAITASENMANTLKFQTSFSGYTKYPAYLYTIAFGSAAPTTWLRNTIATNPTYAYTSLNAGDLNTAFAAIAKRIEKWAEAWIVTDPMGTNIDFISTISPQDQASGLLNFQGNTLSWDLRKATPVSFSNEIYTYSYTYRIRLNTAASDFIPGKAYPTNGTTQLTFVMVEDSLIVSDIYIADFAIPEVKGYAGGALSFTKTGGGTSALSGCCFRLNNLGVAGHSLSTASAVGTGLVSFTNIPSGHTYLLEETFMPAAYEGRYVMSDKTYIVDVKYGVVNVFEAGQGDHVIDMTDFKFDNAMEGRTVTGFVAPMATDDLGLPDFLKMHDIIVELRPTFRTPAAPALSTLSVLQNSSGLGKFTFENVPLGSYVLYIYRAGYLTRAMKVNITNTSPATVELRPPGTEDNGIFNLASGDTNNDLIIENKDYMMILELIGEDVDVNDPRYNPACDLNADGIIDDLDLLMVYARFGMVIWDYAGAGDIDIFN